MASGFVELVGRKKVESEGRPPAAEEEEDEEENEDEEVVEVVANISVGMATGAKPSMGTIAA
jgi:hypothetical protein